MPWWLLLLIFGVAFIYNFVIHKDGLFNPTERYKPSKKKRSKKKGKAKNVNVNTATVLAGAALAHQMIKHHKHDDARDIADDFRDPYDVDIDDMDDLYDLDIENDSYDDSDYDSYRAAYEEEQAAYDDYIASLDMDD